MPIYHASLDKYNDATKQIDQTVSINGAVVSTLSTISGVGAGWGTGKLTQATRKDPDC